MDAHTVLRESPIFAALDDEMAEATRAPDP